MWPSIAVGVSAKARGFGFVWEVSEKLYGAWLRRQLMGDRGYVRCWGFVYIKNEKVFSAFGG